MKPATYQDAIDRLMAFDEESSPEMQAVKDRSGRIRKSAGILQAGDDFARALSGGAYQGTSVAGPMMARAEGLLGDAKDDAEKKRAMLLHWAKMKQGDEQAAADAALKEKMSAEDRRAKLEQWARDREEKRERESRDAALRRELQGNQIAASRENARIMAGQRQDAAADRRAALDASVTERNARREEDRADRADRFLEEEVRRTNSTIGTDYAEGLRGLAELESMVGGEGDIPGVGVHTKVPLVGGMLGQVGGGAEGRRIRQAAQDLKNAYIKSKSGAAVSASEDERIKAALDGAGTEAEFREGLRLVKKAMLTGLASRVGPASPAVKERILPYHVPPSLRGEFDAIGQQPLGSVKMLFPDGKVREVPAEKVDAAKRKGGVPQ